MRTPNIGLQRTSRRPRAAAEAGSFGGGTGHRLLMLVWLAATFGVLIGCTSQSQFPKSDAPMKAPAEEQLSNAYAPLYVRPGEPMCITFADPVGKRCFVSFISLVANPEKFDHMSIQVNGFATLGFENNALYLSRDFAGLSDSRSAIWLDVGGLSVSDPSKLSGQYVAVAGTFDAQNRGHLGGFAGTIKVSHIARWR